MSFPGGASDKELTCPCSKCERCGFNPWVRKTPCRRKWQPTPVLLPAESHGQRSLAVHSVTKSGTHLKRLSSSSSSRFSLLGSSVHGILQARVLEWVAISSSKGIPYPGIEPTLPASPALQADSLLLSHQGSHKYIS